MRSATDVDKKVGKNLAKLRLLRGLTQEKLADAVGVTFQQLQKYEKGQNRISVSRLWQFSQVLEIPVAEFYDGTEGAAHSDALKLTAEQLALLNNYNTLPEPQKQVLRDYMRFLRGQRGQR